MRLTGIFLLLLIFLSIVFSPAAFAAFDPRLVPTNKVGVGLLSPDSEIEEAAFMINHGGDWGWVTIIIKKSERNVERWQNVFNKLNEHHLIPIVRIATDMDASGNWQKPTDEDANAWADFLNKLYFPTKNRYIQIYNEVNRSGEWGGTVDAAEYAKELNKTIDALKTKNGDFYILNAPLDLALATTATSLAAEVFFETMEQTSPGIFKKLDGWASHSYPNPGFQGSPTQTGKTSIKGYQWELSRISYYRDSGDLPVFITETGWKKGDGNGSGLSEDQVADYYKYAYQNVWTDKNVVAVTPFVFNYDESLFHAFAFASKNKIHGIEFYKPYFALKDLSKQNGEPIRENKTGTLEVNFPDLLLKEQSAYVRVTVKNTGNYIWNANRDFKIEVAGVGLEIMDTLWEREQIFPGQDALVRMRVKSKVKGMLNPRVRISYQDQEIATETFSLPSETLVSMILKNINEFMP